MLETLICHYCGEAVPVSTLRVLDVPTPAGDGQPRCVPAPHCPMCASVVEALEGLNAHFGRARPVSER